jgi:hypothetical protein
MVTEVIHERMAAKEFQPFALILANGERLDVKHRDSIAHPSTMVNERRVYSPFIVVIQANGEVVTTRSIAIAMISQVIDEHRMNGAA